MSRGKIPDRWIPYHACGDVIEGTRIICFKVPLHRNVQSRVPGITKIWDIPAVLEDIPNLGAVIDLTNTGRYYNPQDFEAANVSHRKILMPGREIPPENKVREFMNALDEFLGKDCDSLVGVHCTHGLNRTGYMVCRYMRDGLNIPAAEAMKRFEKARGYKIERDNYIADLLNQKPPPPDIVWSGNHQRNKIESQPREGNHSQPWDKNISQPRQGNHNQPWNNNVSQPREGNHSQPWNKNVSQPSKVNHSQPWNMNVSQPREGNHSQPWNMNVSQPREGNHSQPWNKNVSQPRNWNQGQSRNKTESQPINKNETQQWHDNKRKRKNENRGQEKPKKRKIY